LIATDNDPSNFYKIAQFSENSNKNKEVQVACGLSSCPTTGYEGLAKTSTELFAAVEVQLVGGLYKGSILSFNYNLQATAFRTVDYSFTSDNKGFEGITVVTVGTTTNLLALCEGNYCDGGDRGKLKGHGRILRLNLNTALQQWQVVQTIEVPDVAWFEDYSDIDYNPATNQVAIVSQNTAALWVGTLDVGSWTLSTGDAYEFPLNSGKVEWCTVEGVAWKQDGTLVVTTDKYSSDLPTRCEKRGSTVAIFSLPNNRNVIGQ